MLDIGVSHPPSGDEEAIRAARRIELPSWDGSAAVTVEEAGRERLRNGLLEAEKELQRRLADGEHGETTVDSLLSRNIRTYRSGRTPAKGRSSFHTFPARPAGLRWSTVGGHAAASGDLGYTFGRFEAASCLTPNQSQEPRSAEQVRGNFVRLWTRDPQGEWIVLLDLLEHH